MFSFKNKKKVYNRIKRDFSAESYFRGLLLDTVKINPRKEAKEGKKEREREVIASMVTHSF